MRREIFNRLSNRSFPLLGMKTSEMTLEDVFLTLIDDKSKGGKK